MATIGSLSVKLGLVTVEWDQATDKAKKQAKDLQTAFNNLGTGFKRASDLWKEFGGVIGAVSFAGLIQQTMQLTAEIKDLSEGFGVSVSQTLAFRDALMGAGADAASAGKMMSTLFGKIDDAQQGNDKVVAQFEKLGITFREIKETDPYDMILKVAQGFEQITNKAEKAKLIKEFFGKAGIQLDIKEVSQVLEQGTDRFDKYAEGIKAVGQISDNLAKNFENLKIAFAQLMAPFADSSVVKIETYLKILQALAAGGIALGVMKIAVAFYELSKAILAANAAGALFNVVAGGATPIGIAIKLLAAGAAAIVFFSGGPSDSAQVPAPTGPADVGAGEAGVEGSMTKEAMNKRSQVQLTKDLMKLDMERAKIQADFLNQDKLENQLALSNVAMREKLLQIDQKLANEMRSMGDEASKELINQTKALAQAEKIRVVEEAYDREQLLRAKSLYEVKQKMFESEMNYLRSLGNIGADFEQETPEQIREAEDARIRARVGLSNQVKETARLTDLDNKRLEFSNSQMMLDERQANLAMERYDLEAKIADYRREAMGKGETNQTVIEAMIKTIREAGEETIRLKQQTIDAQRTFEYGWAQAYNSFMDSATNAANQGRDVFNTFTNNMASAIDNFVKTGKLSFKDLAKSIIADLIAIQLKASVLSMFRGLGSIFSMGSGGSMMGADYSLSSSSTGLGIKPRASGGDVSSNSPYLVGERGPELFVPNRSGSIIPNHSLAGSMGGGNTVTNVNINAIDTKSFEDRLLNSPNAVWAANQYANKSLAIGRGRS